MKIRYVTLLAAIAGLMVSFAAMTGRSSRILR